MTSYDFSEIEAPVLRASKALRRDGARAVVTNELTADVLAALVGGDVCAVHVRGFFSPSSASRAARRLDEQGKKTLWVAYGDKTDTAFSIGMPRQYAERSKRAAAEYLRAADTANRAIREAFAPAVSPLDNLRLALDELSPAGARLGRFDGRPGLAGLVRTIEPDMLAEGFAKVRGIVHMDDHGRKKDAPKRLSANLYLSMPSRGGELRIWDVATDESNHENLMYRFIAGYGFKPGSQDIIHRGLPKPRVLEPRVGDLILLDTARPHAVAGFTRGRRMTIQTWVFAQSNDRPLTIFS